MQSVLELHDPYFAFWRIRYGSIFFCGCIGIILVSVRLWNRYGVVLAGALTFFFLTTFFREPLRWLWKTSFEDILFCIAVSLCGLILILVAWRRGTSAPREPTYIALTICLLLWTALSRGAVRYDFFIGLPLAFFTAELIQVFAEDISKIPYLQRWQPPFRIRIGAILIILSLLMFYPPAGGHATHTLLNAEHLRQKIPKDNKVTEMFHWMKAEMSATAVVAANWSYGSMLNVLGGVNTIIDQDHYIPHWISLYTQHVYNATTPREILEFLKTYGVTHLMLTESELNHASIRQHFSDNAFIPIYPTDNISEAPVKIWEIHYPDDIQSNPEYLKTGIPEIDSHFSRE